MLFHWERRDWTRPISARANPTGVFAAYIDVVHRIAIFHTVQPVLCLVFRVDDSMINKIEEGGLRIVAVFAETFQELVRLGQVEDV
jgi:hypothetical protein